MMIRTSHKRSSTKRSSRATHVAPVTNTLTFEDLPLIDKTVSDVIAAVSGIASGQTLLISGFGDAGTPVELLEAILETSATDLTVVANNAGSGERGLAALLREDRVRKVITSYPRSRGSIWFEAKVSRGRH